jgi:hypothetical protein
MCEHKRTRGVDPRDPLHNLIEPARILLPKATDQDDFKWLDIRRSFTCRTKSQCPCFYDITIGEKLGRAVELHAEFRGRRRLDRRISERTPPGRDRTTHVGGQRGCISIAFSTCRGSGHGRAIDQPRTQRLCPRTKH